MAKGGVWFALHTITKFNPLKQIEMKAITKAQVIDLLDVINRDDEIMINSDIISLSEEKDMSELFFDVVRDGDMLPAGRYFVLCFEEVDMSDFPVVTDWVNGNLSEDNIEIEIGREYAYLIICLD